MKTISTTSHSAERDPDVRQEDVNVADIASVTGSGHESDSNAVSNCSTVENDYESFATFQNKVQAFVQRVLWPGAKPSEITVGRLPGGSYNRILTASFRKQGFYAEFVPAEHLIIRIPREDRAEDLGGMIELDKDVALLNFIDQRTPIPAPRVVQYDMTHGNEFGRKHMVQTRLRGEPILNFYDRLGPEVRCKIASELGGIYRQLLNKAESPASLRSPPATAHCASPPSRAPAPPRPSTTATPATPPSPSLCSNSLRRCSRSKS